MNTLRIQDPDFSANGVCKDISTEVEGSSDGLCFRGNILSQLHKISLDLYATNPIQQEVQSACRDIRSKVTRLRPCLFLAGLQQTYEQTVGTTRQAAHGKGHSHSSCQTAAAAMSD